MVRTIFLQIGSTALTAAFCVIVGGCVADSAPEMLEVASPVEEESGGPETEGESSDELQTISSEKNEGIPFETIPENVVKTAEDLKASLDAGETPFILDIRPMGWSALGFIEGSKNIPAGRQLDIRIDEIPTDQTIVIVTKGTDRLAEVRQTLIDAGYDEEKILVVKNGMDDWEASGYPMGTRRNMGC